MGRPKLEKSEKEVMPASKAKLRVFNFPAEGVTVQAADAKDALEKLKQLTSKSLDHD